jgi:hypothetical protein
MSYNDCKSANHEGEKAIPITNTLACIVIIDPISYPKKSSYKLIYLAL